MTFPRCFCAAALSAFVLLGVPPTPAGADGARPTCHGTSATIVGTSHHDQLNATAGRDVIVARAGNDRVDGLTGRDMLCAGAGNDRVTLSGGRAWTGGGHDVVTIDADEATARVGRVELGAGSDILHLFGDNVEGGTVWSAGGGRDYFANHVPDASTSVYVVTLGPNGNVEGRFSASLRGFEDYSSDEPLAPQDVRGSRRANFISVFGNGSEVLGRGGDDFLQTMGTDTSADGGAGTDTCLNFTVTTACE